MTDRWIENRANPRAGWAAALFLFAAALWLAATTGCGDDPASPAPPEDAPAPWAHFYEPVSYCLTGSRTSDTLWVYNLGDTTLVWEPANVPEGMTGFEESLRLDPRTVVPVVWTWNPAGPYPVLDTLVAETNDPHRPRAEVLFRRLDPVNPGVPAFTPSAPIPGYPPDDFTVAYPDTVTPLFWSRVGVCRTRFATYTVDVSEAPFTGPNPGPGAINLQARTDVELVFDGRGNDRGITVYWRVRANDSGIVGPWSEVRRIRHQ